jgi:hypothetical protein
MTTLVLSPIVEGHGEVQALPVLLRRLGLLLAPGLSLKINPPLRVPRNRFLNDQSEFTRYVELAARKAAPAGAVLILLDADADCPAVLGPALLARARAVRSDTRIAVVLARREFEAWFLAAAVSLRGTAGLPADLVPPPGPEEIPGAKEWLARLLPYRKYIEPRHQPVLAACFNLEAARSAPSFDKFYREIARLLAPPP